MDDVLIIRIALDNVHPPELGKIHGRHGSTARRGDRVGTAFD